MTDRVEELTGRFRELVKDRHEPAKQWKARTGGKVVGYFCTYVPEEILCAAGMLPVRILGSHEVQDIVSQYLPKKWCPFCRDCLATGLKGDYDYLDGVVYGHSCVALKMAFFSWCRHLKPAFSYELWVPRIISSNLARANLVKSLEEFKESLEKWTGRAISDEALRAGIELCNANRRLLRQVYETRKQDSPPISGAETMEVVLASMFADKAQVNPLLESLVKALGEAKERVTPGVRLMILGSENDDVDLVRMIESLGANVVIDDHCTGSRYFWNEAVAGKPPLESIADRYADRPPCPNKDPIENRRLKHILALAQEYRVQGAVLIQQKFCDPHQWFAPEIVKALNDRNIRTLFLEADVTVPHGQFRTRVEAFLEMFQLEIV